MNNLRKKVLGLYTNQPRKKVDKYSGDDEYVIVKPLEWISINDVYDVTQIIPFNDSALFDEEKKQIISFYNNIDSGKINLNCNPFELLQVSDLLRDRGYAIPAFGHSVEELINDKIFKYVISDIAPTPSLQEQKINIGAKKKANKSKRFSKMLDPKELKDNYFNDEL